MYFKLTFGLVILAFLLELTYSVQISTYGPYLEPKNTPQIVFADNAGKVVKLSTIDSGCTSSSSLKIIYYPFALSQLSQVYPSPSYTLPCNGGLSFIAASLEPVSGDFYFMVSAASEVRIYQSNGSMPWLKGSMSPSVDDGSANVGITALNDGTVYVTNSSLIQVWDQNSAFYTAAHDGYIAGSTTDGTSMYFLTYDSSKFILFKVTNSIIVRNVTVTPTATGVVSFFTSASSNGLSVCNGRVYITFTSDTNQMNVLTFATADFTPGPAVLEVLNSQQGVSDVGCVRDTGAFAAVVAYTSGFSLTNFSITYSVYTYSNTLTRLSADRLRGSPPSSAQSQALGFPLLATTRRGTLYIHREGRLATGTTGVVFGFTYSFESSYQYGPSRNNCTCLSSQCDFGEYGTGLCLGCDNNKTAGVNCQLSCSCKLSSTPCSNGINGNTTCFCDDPKAFGLNCDSCSPGYYFDNTKHCTICPILNVCVNSTKQPCDGNYYVGMSRCLAPTSKPPEAYFPDVPTDDPNNNGNDGSSHLGTSASIALGVVCGVVGVILIIAGIFFYYKYRKQTSKGQTRSNSFVIK